MFFALMVFPTVIIVDVWTFMQDGSQVVGHSGNWLFVLMILGFPAVYFASYVDECTINLINSESNKVEPKEIFQKRRLGLVQVRIHKVLFKINTKYLLRSGNR